MTRLFIPELKRVPPGASDADRRRMYEEYVAELRRMNPHLYNADGSRKSLWQWLRGMVS